MPPQKFFEHETPGNAFSYLLGHEYGNFPNEKFILKQNFLYTHARPNTIDQPGKHSTSVSGISQKIGTAHCIISFAA